MFFRQAAAGLRRILRHPGPVTSATKFGRNNYHSSGGQTQYPFQSVFVYSQAALFLGIMHSTPVLAEDVSSEPSSDSGLRKIEDGSVVSNLHTSKWRVFTDNGRDSFLKGKLQDAERLFLSALQEAKTGFGERDPHVASSCNNLAELYRVKKAFDKAEPLYMEAIDILEESYGREDIRVGAALHNLGRFYLLQRKLEQAHGCYERAIKIKRRILGEGHSDYAESLYHLGMVLNLLGKGEEAEALIQDSIRILEESGQGGSFICIRRQLSLAQLYIKSHRLNDAVNIQRKMLHTMEVLKGWNSMDTVITAEGLARTLESAGSLEEAQEILERCLGSRKTLLPEDHIQIAANMLYIARVEMLKSNLLWKTSRLSEAVAELGKAKDLLSNAIMVAQKVSDKLMKQKGQGSLQKDEQIALVILSQARNAFGLLEIVEVELQESREHPMPVLDQCIAASFKESMEYLSCLKRVYALLNNRTASSLQEPRRTTLQELEDEMKRVEGEVSSPTRKHGN